MKIYKRDGFIADFIPTKIGASLFNCANEYSIPLTEGDVKFILNSILKKLNDMKREENFTSSYEIKGLVYKVLCENGFCNIAIKYISR